MRRREHIEFSRPGRRVETIAPSSGRRINRVVTEIFTSRSSCPGRIPVAEAPLIRTSPFSLAEAVRTAVDDLQLIALKKCFSESNPAPA